ncbi:hypothetical protein [Kordiimonas lacus]|uniref:DUF945 domain-containing protein n=1 Tax=Kordiimonas lacus TaxID=637679 RepID=A0A1G7DC88_9PROT|nr:hypothetical protein [Kordiimonas lacus]SDE49162.1 hypothetical protein SAMN04488071_3045 [Kordiimonas lacus]
MGRTAILTTAVVGAAAIGGYFFLANSFEAQVQAQVDSIISNPDLDVDVTYDSLKTDLFSGTAMIEGIKVINPERPDSEATVKSVNLDIGFNPIAGSATVDGFRIEGLDFSEKDGSFSLESGEVRGADLPAVMTAFQEETLQDWPFTLVEVQGAKMEGTPANNPSQKVMMSLNTARMATNGDLTRVNEFLIDDFVLNAANNGSFTLGRYEVTGFDIGWIKDLIAMNRAPEDEEGSGDALEMAAAASLAKASLNYMGIDSFKIEDFKFDMPMQGMAMSFKEISVKDLVRPADLVLGGTMKIDAFELKGMQNTSPQAMQILTLADLDTIRIDMDTSTRFEKATDAVTTVTTLALDKLIKLQSEGTIGGIDAARMSEKLLAYQTEQMLEAFRAADAETPPQQDPFAQVLEALSVYTGYYDSVDLTLGLEDQGLISRSLKVYSALSGMPEDQLREQFTMMAIAQTAPALGEGAPENLADVIQAYMAPQSQPMRISMRSLVPMTEEALNGITPQTWQDVFGLKLETVASTGTPASN